MVELKAPLTTLWRGKDVFEEVKTLQGEVFRGWRRVEHCGLSWTVKLLPEVA